MTQEADTPRPDDLDTLREAAMLLELFLGEGRIAHRIEPPNERCAELMPIDGTCDCGVRSARAIARAAVGACLDCAMNPGLCDVHGENIHA